MNIFTQPTKNTMGYDASEQLESILETTSVDMGAAAQSDFMHYFYDTAGNRTGEQAGGGVRQWAANDFNQLATQSVGGKLELRGTAGANPGPRATVTIDGQAAAMFDDGEPATSGREWRKEVNAASGANSFALVATEDVPPGFVPQVVSKTIGVTVTPDATITFTYDADGNLKTDGLSGYMWDAESRLVSVWTSTSGGAEFAYDAFNRRVRVKETAANSAVTANKQLIWDGLTIVQQRDTMGYQVRTYFGNGEQRRATNVSSPPVTSLLYTTDHLGSIRELVEKETGYIRARYDYSPYGVRTKVSGDLDSDFGFTGHYTNEKSGLVLAPYRAYAPKLGRWISRDPIGEDGGINLYGYVGGSPGMGVDPTGENPVWIVIRRKAILGGAGYCVGGSAELWKQLWSGEYDKNGFDFDAVATNAEIVGGATVLFINKAEAFAIEAVSVNVWKTYEGIATYCRKKAKDPAWPYDRPTVKPPVAPSPPVKVTPPDRGGAQPSSTPQGGQMQPSRPLSPAQQRPSSGLQGGSLQPSRGLR